MDRVCHFEIPFADCERASKFYQSVFGWQIMQAPGGMPYYFAITTEMNEQFQPTKTGGINGGLYQRDECTAQTPVVVIEVDSCAQRIKDVEAAGGSLVVGPNEIPGMGIYAQVKDCENNIIGLWQNQHAPC
jgi:predicted enzyme related to lactoylglutathione lyase